MCQAHIRLTICTPYPIAAETLKTVFAHQPDVSVVRGTTTPTIALRWATESDIVLAHAAYPRQVVLDLCRAVSTTTSALVIVFGTPPGEAGLLGLIEFGARGYVPSGRPFNEWREILRAVASDGACIEPQLTSALLKRHRELHRRVARLA